MVETEQIPLGQEAQELQILLSRGSVGTLVLLLGFSRGNCFWPLVGQEMGLS